MFKWLKAKPRGDTATVESASGNEHAVIVHFEYGQDDLDDLHETEERLRRAVDEAAAGEHDGHEIAVDGSHGVLYLYGPDADVLFATIKPIVLSAPCLKNPRAILRYGRADDPHARESSVDFGVH